MSRHKLVKALDIDDELDDYDGAADEEYENELAPEDKEHLRRGALEVRNTIGPDVALTDREIEDSLYYYYYDVQKTVNYLLNQKSKVQKSREANDNAHKTTETHPRTSISRKTSHVYTTACAFPISASGFFKDCPWLDVPQSRRAEILVEPRHPRGGLLGGSPTESGPPKSKLAALAAARKRKEAPTSEGIAGRSDSSVSLLDRLGSRPRHTALATPNSQIVPRDETQARSVPEKPLRKYPSRKRDASLVEPQKEPPESQDLPPVQDLKLEEGTLQTPPKASPSSLASTVFHVPRHMVSASTTLSIAFAAYPRVDAKSDPFAELSPDDVVLRAQTSKGTKNAKDPAKSSNQKPATTDAVTQGVADVTIAEVPKVKSKNLDVRSEYEKSSSKRSANFVVIGHVDAGKSTLMGRLLHDLDLVTARQYSANQQLATTLSKPSFALAFALDTGTEERARGVTIDISSRSFSTQHTQFTILDAPGHKDFIPNMLAGAAAADFAVLVIDASTGNFESGLKGQTREHALLVRSMGVQRLVVAVNKLDSVNWSQDRFNEIQQQISSFLIGAGFRPANLTFIPCSGLTGDNIVHLSKNPNAAWYTGSALLTALEDNEPITRALDKPLRMTIDDIFRGGVQNPLSVSGRIGSGTLQTGDPLVIMPGGHTASIKGIEVDNDPRDWSVAGSNTTLHLTEIDAQSLRVGDVLCPPSSPIRCLTAFTVKILAFSHVMPMHVEVLRGRLHAPGRITDLLAVLDKHEIAAAAGSSAPESKKKKKKKPRLIQPNSVARVAVEVEEAVALDVGARVVLRSGGETVGAGLVE